MSTESALGPLDPAVFEEILADREDAYKRQGNVLYWAVAALIVVTLGLAATVGGAVWAITKERDHLYVMEENPATGARSIVAPAKPVSTLEGRQNAADQWLREAFTVTQDINYNINLRGSAIEKMNAPKEDKDIFEEIARADIEANRGYVHTVDSIDFYPPQVHDPAGLTFEAMVVLKIQDMREGMASHDPMKFQRFMVSIIMKEVPPRVEKPRNLAGLIFLPVTPRPLKEKTNVAGK